jgi:hypothetical protein
MLHPDAGSRVPDAAPHASHIMVVLAAGPDGRFLRLRMRGEESPNSAEQCAG